MEDYDRYRFMTIAHSSSPKRGELLAHEFGRTVLRIAMTLTAKAASLLEWVGNPLEFPEFAPPQFEGNTLVGVVRIGDVFAYGVAIDDSSKNIVILSLSRGSAPREYRTFNPSEDYIPDLFADAAIKAVAYLVAKEELGEPSQLR
jgi:hypothetical protein